MLVGIMGKMGSGKTLAMTTLAAFIHQHTKAPIFANYKLKIPYTPIDNIGQLWKAENGIFLFDEIWLSMDSRSWAYNVKMTHWVNQTRKKKLLVMYTTQHISQVEMRARNATDILIYTEKKPAGHCLTFIDWQYQQLGRRYMLDKPERFYNLYDTFEVVKPVSMRY